MFRLTKKKMMNDRRSGLDRRTLSRNAVKLGIEWEGSSGRRSGTVSDLSEAGCFVLSGGDISDGETVRLFMPLTDGMRVEFSGTVANHVFEIGFAVLFRNLTQAQKNMIYNLFAFPLPQ